ncbi:hypothetical protein PACTADRAFT_1043 [Pachysolen tannophilus NRRL Y-2460]|uniref:BTB domain-containing protein n=1 Tax=Pachysolen tannophilus NRRL Y-2460 TaxID=669874 RepID=A0A1E4U3J0_PACTA|nr:hypothetical protein PACTADRAFT_1043 [Pachysolen tannophilus NRRL Y-2460]
MMATTTTRNVESLPSSPSLLSSAASAMSAASPLLSALASAPSSPSSALSSSSISLSSISSPSPGDAKSKSKHRHNHNNNNHETVSSKLPKLTKDELNIRDCFGRTILHIICLTNRYDYLKYLFKNPNLNILITDYESNWNCLHYAIHNNNFIMANLILNYNQEQFKNLTELLIKHKDREGYTPLDLLSSENDLRSFIYIPISIGFHHPSITESHNKNAIKHINISYRSDINHSHHWFTKDRGGNEVWLFGSNKNNNLGCSDSVDRLVPIKVKLEKLKYNYGNASFYPKLSERISLPRIRDLKLSKLHTIILTTDSMANIYISGIGSRGRLGLGNLQPQYQFVPITKLIHEKILEVSISDDHTLVLTANNEIFSWGLNNFNQLGYNSEPGNGSNFTNYNEPMSLEPRKILSADLKKNNSKIIGINCSKIHSLCYTKDSIYLWGLNIGQMGSVSVGNTLKYNNYKGVIQKGPKLLSFNYGTIKQVACTEIATLVLTSSDELHLYLNGFHVKVQVPLFNKIIDDGKFHTFKPKIYSRRNKIIKIIIKSNSDICLILFDNGDIIQFKIISEAKNANDFSKNLKFINVWKATKDHLKCVDSDIGSDGSVILCVKDGSVYKRIKRTEVKNFNNHSKPSSSLNSVTASLSSVGNVSRGKKEYKFQKVLKLNNIVKVFADPLFATFGFIKDDLDLLPHKLLKNQFLDDMSFLSPLIDSPQGTERKKLQVLREEIDDNNDKYLICNFVHKTELHGEEEEFFYHKLDNDYLESSIAISSTNDKFHDLYYNKYKGRWLPHEELKFSRIYEIKKYDEFCTYLFLDDDGLQHYVWARSDASIKKYDFFLILNKDSLEKEGFRIPVHKFILSSRSSVFKKLFITKEPVVEKIDTKDYSMSIDVGKNEIYLDAFDVRSVLIMLCHLYTDDFICTWDKYMSDSLTSEKVSIIKKSFQNLATFLNVSNFNFNNAEHKKTLTKCFNGLLSVNEENPNNDTVIYLIDDEAVYCHSSILVSRSSYFEIALSDNWYPSRKSKFRLKEIFLKHMQKDVFMVMLKYIYGYNMFELFDGNIGEKDFSTVADFINFVLLCIDAANELLLFELKDFLELAVKDFINSENVLILLQHSYTLDCQKLMENCLFFIYCNIDNLLFNSEFAELINESDHDLLNKVDYGLKWFKTLKSERRNSNLKNGRSFFERNSDVLLKEFIYDLDKYNLNLIESTDPEKKFEPIFEKLKNNPPIQSKKENAGSNSMKKAENSISARKIVDGETHTAIPGSGLVKKDIAEVKGNVMGTPRKDIESAVSDENEEDGFVPVVNNRRRRSSSKKTLYNLPSKNNHADHSVEDLKKPKERRASNLDTSVSSLDFKMKTAPINISSASRRSVGNVSLFFDDGFSSRENSPSLKKVEALPILSGTSPTTFDSSQQKPKQKVFFSTPRISQKERKKRNLDLEKLNTDYPFSLSNGNNNTNNSNNNNNNNNNGNGNGNYVTNNAWGVSGASSSNSSSSNLVSLMPTFADAVLPAADTFQKQAVFATKKKSPKSVATLPSSEVMSATPSLSEIMYEENHKIEEKVRKSSNTKSLLEIQKEEEFEKWFLEESIKYQKQIKIMNEEPSSSSNHKGRRNLNNKNGNNKRTSKNGSDTKGAKKK